MATNMSSKYNDLLEDFLEMVPLMIFGPNEYKNRLCGGWKKKV